MKLRKLQRMNDEDKWVDNAYAYEDETGRTIFRYSVLTWGRVGAACNVQLQKTDTPLTKVETIIPASERLRWLPIEEIDADQADVYLEVLNQACLIPKPEKASIATTAAA